VIEIHAHAHRLVRAVAREAHTRVAQELFELAADGRKTWTHAEWQAVLAALDSSRLTVGEWLQSRADWL
jgi:hypothetical protein